MTIEEAIALAQRHHVAAPKSFPLPSAAQVDQISAATGLTLHPDFRTYLLKASNLNVGYIEPVCLNPASAHNCFWTVLKDARAIGVPGNQLPICEDNGDFYLVNEEGVVRFWSHSSGAGESWPNIATWIKEVWVEGG